MRTILLCGALSLIGLFACVESREEAPDPAPEEAESQAESALGLCCIDFTCPSPEFETTGCKTGTPSIAAAYAACNAECPVLCQSSGLYCF